VFAVDHRFALSRPALLTAPDKNHSPAPTPRFWHAASNHRWSASTPEAGPPNRPAAPSARRAFQLVIWFACASYYCASCASVVSFLTAAIATFALKAGLCTRLTHLATLAPDMRHYRRFQADFPLIGLSELGQPPL
jgi:hypothetical protein